MFVSERESHNEGALDIISELRPNATFLRLGPPHSWTLGLPNGPLFALAGTQAGTTQPCRMVQGHLAHSEHRRSSLGRHRRCRIPRWGAPELFRPRAQIGS